MEWKAGVKELFKALSKKLVQQDVMQDNVKINCSYFVTTRQQGPWTYVKQHQVGRISSIFLGASLVFYSLPVFTFSCLL